jgi:hypothetical protein
MKNGIDLISEERLRQISVEGWTQQHDDQHTDNSLAKAAACYAMPKETREMYQSLSKVHGWFPRWWPESWDLKFWKPTPKNRIRELVKAGALIAAEIDRLKRLPTKKFKL